MINSGDEESDDEHFLTIDEKRRSDLERFKLGPRVWNKWVDEHPNESVDFQFAVFDSGSEILDFEPYKFPSGTINFEQARFLGRVSFSGVKFVCKDLLFHKAIFSESEIDNTAGFWIFFINTEFNCETLDFAEAMFHEGVSFSSAKFVCSEIFFSNCSFLAGDFTDKLRVDFGQCKIDCRYFGFNGSVFGDTSKPLEDHLANFSDAVIRAETLSIGQTSFRFFRILFDNAQIEARRFDLNNLSCEECSLSMAAMSFTGTMIFSPETWTDCPLLSMNAAVIEGSLTLDNISGPTSLDLRLLSVSRTLFLTNIDIDPLMLRPPTQRPAIAEHHSVEWFKMTRPTLYCLSAHALKTTFGKEVYPEDEHLLFRALKILAEDSGNHRLALDANAVEYRADFRHAYTGVHLLLVQMYSIFSDYGRSVFRPIIGLTLFYLLTIIFYLTQTTKTVSASMEGAITLASANLFPFTSASVAARSTALLSLFDNLHAVPGIVMMFGIVHGVISAVLVFLVALALRNMFRLR
ncbi:hypothetical protein DIT71_00020 [Marinobacter vulgaris]|uniref:Pentapeptide repeat-containing protein n=1 Tax=Marinobacter vulgaris TaxID=1928331 RepID=A0A2V3ZPE8_9GAMM|nr:hypothetical protein [Marinobacter vulgaris]PXX93232.1 hypothetical protein DIT71_00020 [Marinobacter vulgaris]TSJ72756.1 hypothetical protein FPC41_03245 [Marinobacter vulgaris]